MLFKYVNITELMNSTAWNVSQSEEGIILNLAPESVKSSRGTTAIKTANTIPAIINVEHDRLT
jgi:hypothetical protein